MRICRLLALAASALMLASSCATGPKMVWVRTDGQRLTDNPALQQQFVVDGTICKGERQKADLSGTVLANGSFAAIMAASERSSSADQVMLGCMAQHGYLFVEADKAPQVSASFAATHQPPPAQTPAVQPSARVQASSRKPQGKIAPGPAKVVTPAAAPQPAEAAPDESHTE